MTPVLTPRTAPKRPPPISVRIPEDLLADIETAASGLKLSRSEAILQLLRFAIAEHKKEAGRKAKR